MLIIVGVIVKTFGCDTPPENGNKLKLLEIDNFEAKMFRINSICIT